MDQLYNRTLMSNITGIIASYWTVAGGAYPLAPSETSTFDFSDRVEAAASAGYSGMGFIHQDLVAVRAELGFSEMRRILEANGIKDVEVEIITDWFATGERRAKSDAIKADLLSAGEALGARAIKVMGDATDTKASWPHQLLVDSFVGLCADAGRVGMKVGIEIMPWTNFSTIANTMPIVEAAGTANGGLYLDIWLMVRGGVDLAEIGRLAPKYIVSIEINDAAKEVPGGDLWSDTVNNRLLCGEGSFDIARFMSEVKKAGYSGPCGVEILSKAQRQKPLAEAATSAIRSARPYIELTIRPD
jgi:sugar phosphate isomerase/epimerase